MGKKVIFTPGEVCPNTDDGVHVPDLTTVHVDRDGDGVYIDVNCGPCGRSGCIGRFSATEVDW